MKDKHKYIKKKDLPACDIIGTLRLLTVTSITVNTQPISLDHWMCNLLITTGYTNPIQLA